MVEWPFYVGGVLHGESTGLKAVGYTLECIDFSRSWDLLSWSRKAWLPVDHDASFDEIEEAFPEMRC